MREELLALAERDAELLRARHEVAHPPSLGELEELDRALGTLRQQKRQLDEVRVPLAERSASLERDGAAATERVTRLADRLRVATGGGRELEAMAHEMATERARASALDDELLGVLGELEPLDQQDAALRSAFRERSELRDTVAARVEEEHRHASAQVAALEAERPQLTGSLDAALLARYEAAAARAGGVGAAELVDGRCGVCRVAVPSAVADRLLRGGDPDLVVVCDECGRLLVR